MIQIIKKLFYNDVGKYLISIILGIGLASIFRKVCKDRNCMVFKGPKIDEIKGQTYIYNDKCYSFKEKAHQCNSKEKTIEFA